MPKKLRLPEGFSLFRICSKNGRFPQIIFRHHFICCSFYCLAPLPLIASSKRTLWHLQNILVVVWAFSSKEQKSNLQFSPQNAVEYCIVIGLGKGPPCTNLSIICDFGWKTWFEQCPCLYINHLYIWHNEQGSEFSFLMRVLLLYMFAVLCRLVVGAFYNLRGRKELGIQITKILLRNNCGTLPSAIFFLFAVLDESFNYIILRTHSETLNISEELSVSTIWLI